MALLNGLESEAYLQYVLEHTADLPINRIDKLLPWSARDALASERTAV